MFKAKEIPNFIYVSDVFHLVAYRCDSGKHQIKHQRGRKEVGKHDWTLGSGDIQNVISWYCPYNMK